MTVQWIGDVAQQATGVMIADMIIPVHGSAAQIAEALVETREEYIRGMLERCGYSKAYVTAHREDFVPVFMGEDRAYVVHASAGDLLFGYQRTTKTVKIVGSRDCMRVTYTALSLDDLLALSPGDVQEIRRCAERAWRQMMSG